MINVTLSHRFAAHLSITTDIDRTIHLYQERTQELTERVFLLFFPPPPLLPPFPPLPSPFPGIPTSSLPFPPFPVPPLPLLLPSFPVPFPPLPLEVDPLNQLGSLGERCKLPQRVRGRAPAEIEFGAL